MINANRTGQRGQAGGGTPQAQELNLKARRISTLKVEGEYLYWLEQRANEQGRGVIMRWSEVGGLEDMLKAPYSARSRVHEYGGGEFCPHKESLYFVNADDQQIYQCDAGREPEAITAAPHYRFADIEYDPVHDRLIAVAEHHPEQSGLGTAPRDQVSLHPEAMLVYIGLKDAERGGVTILDQNHDFYAAPRLSPDGTKLAYLQWDLPDMPWEAASLMISPVNPMDFEPKRIAGGRNAVGGGNSACFGPQWAPDGKLFFIHDATGIGQLYVLTDDQTEKVPHQDDSADSARPLWVFGMESLAINDEGEVFLASEKKGQTTLQHIDKKQISGIPAQIRSLEYPVALGQNLAALVTLDDAPETVALITPDTAEITPIRSSADGQIRRKDVSLGRMLEIPVEDGTIYANYYPPVKSVSRDGASEGAPPALVTIHGGPTARGGRGLNASVYHWTSRGFAVLDVDYRGSTGYGKAYREALDGQWGIADVNDIISAAEYLVENNLAAKGRLFVEGGSAGGYTALMALVKSECFRAAACRYPVTDLAQLLDITHKFEAGYVYSLTDTNKQTAKDRLKERAVLANINAINAPVIFFQGADDKVVPPVQPKTVYEALKDRGIMTEYHEFAGEGHGFRRKETLKMVAEATETFFLNVLNESNQ